MGRMMITDSGGYARTSDAMMSSKTNTKKVPAADGSGGIMDYPDTNSDIVRDQKGGNGKIQNRPMKPGYRY